MKRFISLLMLIFVANVSIAGTRTIKADKVLLPDVTSPNSITWKYKGVAADSLTANQDTVIYNITVNKSVPMNYYIESVLDTIDGADTVKYNINGRMFDSQAWTLIETVTVNVPSETSTVIESMTDPDYTYGTASAVDTLEQITAADADTITVAARTMTPIPSINPCYRQVQIEIIRIGKGEGLTLESLNWYFQEVSN